MSLVLAFGLSPIGQAPAYAAQDKQPAAEEVLQTQAWANNITVGVTTNPIVYKGASYVTDLTTAGDDLYGAGLIWTYYTNPTNNVETVIEPPVGTLAEYTAAKEAYDAAVAADTAGSTQDTQAAVTQTKTALDALGNFYEFFSGYKYMQGTDEIDPADVKNVGSYSIVFTGAGTHKSESVTGTFSIQKFDLSASDVTLAKNTLTTSGGGFYTGSWETIAFSDSDGPTVYSEKQGIASGDAFKLGSTDFDFSPTQVKDRGYKGVTITGKGANVTGSKAVGEVQVAKGQFTSVGGLTVNGVANTYANAVDASADAYQANRTTKATSVDDAKFVTSIDLTTEDNASKSPSIESPDPVATGMVKFGDTELAKRDAATGQGDYTVEYYGTTVSGGKVVKNASDKKDAAPTEIGTYVAEITIASEDFDTSTAPVLETVSVLYNVTGETLDEVAARAELGSATYIAPTTAYPDDQRSGGSLTPGGTNNNVVVAPTSVAFVDADGKSVTDKVGANYRLGKVYTWDEDDEKELLGDAYYDEDHYYYKDEHYTNPNATVISSTGQAPVTIYRDNVANVVGYKGLNAGDYKVELLGDGDLVGGEPVYGKFTVEANTPTVGEAVGQIVVTTGEASNGAPARYDGLDSGKELKLEMVTYKAGKVTEKATLVDRDSVADVKSARTTLATKQADLATAQAALAADPDDGTLQGNVTAAESAVANAQAALDGAIENADYDYSVVYKKDGKEVDTFKESGTYDATLTFNANYGKKTLEIKDAVKADKATLESLLNKESVAGYYMYPAVSYYSGSGIDLTPVFLGSYSSASELATAVEGAYTGSTPWANLTNVQKAAAADEFVEGLVETGTGVVTKIDKAAYAVTSKAGAATTATTAAGKPVGVGDYVPSIAGAGDYKGEPTTAKMLNIDGKAHVEKMDISTPAYTMQFKDGDKWVEQYSTTMGTATKIEPAFRLVTTATKDSSNPVEIPSSAYTYKYENNTGAQLGAKVTLTTPATTNSEEITHSFPFAIAKGTFADSSIQVTLDKDTAAYVGSKVTPKITVGAANAAPLTEQGVAPAGHGQYVVTITDEAGKTVYSSTGVKDGIVHAGKYAISVTGGESAEYGGDALTASFEVTPIKVESVKDKNLKVTGTKSFSYDGSKKTAVTQVQYKPDGTTFETLKDLGKDESATGATYKVENNTNTEAGEYKATVVFSGDYEGSVDYEYTIGAQQISQLTMKVGDKVLADSAVDAMAATSDGDVYIVGYDGKAHEPAIEFYDGDTKLENMEATIVYENQTNASTAEKCASVLVIGSNSNYTGRTTKYFKITGYDITSDRVKVTYDDEQLKYNGGKAVQPVPTITYTMKSGETFALQKDVDFTLQYTNEAINPGDKGTVKIIGLDPNFVEGDVTFINSEFTVQAAPAEQEITASNVSLAYGATKKVTASAKTELTFVPDNSGVYSVDAAGNVKALKVGSGKLTIKAAATDEFKAAEKTITVKVTKAANTKFKVTAKKKAYTAKRTANKAFKASALYKVTGKAGKVTYKKANTAGAKKIVVAKNGKITVKKGLKAGTYKVKVKATSAANANYKAASKNVTIKVKVTKK